MENRFDLLPLLRTWPLNLLVSVSRTAIVVYQLFFQMVLGKSYSWAAIIKFLTQVSLGAYVSLIFFGMANNIILVMTFFLVQCRHWSCFRNNICFVAWVYF